MPRVLRKFIWGWILLLGFTTAQGVPVWTNNATLWTAAVQQAPRKARPHINYGEVLREAGDKQTAAKEFQLAAALARARPDQRHDGVERLALADLAQTRLDLGDIAGAQGILAAVFKDGRTIPAAQLAYAELALAIGWCEGGDHNPDGTVNWRCPIGPSDR